MLCSGAAQGLFHLSLPHSHSNRSICSFNPSYPLLLSSSTLKLHHFLPLSPLFLRTLHASSAGTSVEHVVCAPDTAQKEGNWEPSLDGESGRFEFDMGFESSELRKLQFKSPALEVKELEELPENWRRSKLAWLCKELPAHKRPTMTRLLNAQKKWMTQEDATYVSVHCMRIRENEAGFWVYKWMIQQHWFRFDFALATKLADYVGRERKFAKCREIFDDILNQGRLPSESTFHILIAAYLSASGKDCLEEACDIYNRMIHLGGYRPRLSLHNALFRALVSKPGNVSKQYLKQAEFIFHNLSTCGLDIHKDIYGGLIWLQSYQDMIDKERISSLRKEMLSKGIEEGRDVLLSILRASSKEGNVDEVEQTWLKLLLCDGGIPSQAFVYKMEVYAKAGNPMKSLEIFREMQGQLGSVNIVAYHKIIEVLCEAQKLELAESLMEELAGSRLKPLRPSYLDLLNMYFNLSLHEKVESTFSQCLDKCSPNRAIYSIYLDSLVQTGNIEKAEMIFNEMLENASIGVDARSSNTILRGYLCCENHVKADKIYRFMCQKKYEVGSTLMEKLDRLLSSRRKVLKKPTSMKLSHDQREILVGLLLGGLQIECVDNKKHRVCFVFKDNTDTHSILKRHVNEMYHEWLVPSKELVDGNNDIPSKFITIPHSCFNFYADQFWPNGGPMVPKLIHRWLSPRVLAYWYMYSGHRTSSGDILLKVRGSKVGAERIFRALKAKSLDFKIKQKGKVFWVGFLGSNSTCFWELVEPYILYDLKDCLKPHGQNTDNGDEETANVSFASDSESDESYKSDSELSDIDKLQEL